MKKFAIILLSLVLIVASVAVVACAVNPDTCTHKWGEWKRDENSVCTEAGQLVRTCTICKKVDTQEVDAAPHQILSADGTVATCQQVDLSSSQQCSLCGETISGTDLYAAVSHSTSISVKGVEPTCTETGLTEGRKCLACQNIVVPQQTIPALGHNVVDVAATVATCTEAAYSAGTQCSRCKEYFTGHEETAPAFGHDFQGATYFTYVACANNCGSYGKLAGGNPFEAEEFVYDFDATKQAEIDALYEQIEKVLKQESESEDYLIELFEAFDEYVGYVQQQYQFAQVLNDINYNAKSRKEFSAISEYYITIVARYYTLFKEINDSVKYGDYFWNYTEWDEDYIAYVLEMADSYDPDSRSTVDDILEQYEALLEKGVKTQKQKNQLYSLYSQLVIANNNIATAANYKNYMDYAYAEVYERDYKPEDVEVMRAYVKQYIGPILADVAQAYEDWDNAYEARGGWSNRQSQLYYSQYVGNWMWGNPNNYLDDAQRRGMILDSRKSISDYFQFLNEGDQNVDFYGALENLFEKGNFFMGANTNITAYTWYIYSKDTPILVFGGDEEYQGAFTFIHEFGHYYQFVHNDLLSVPMDHDETQSQGNEMLFLAWLREHMPADVYEGFEILELEQLLNMLGSVIMSTAVDELEYLVYTGATTYNGAAIPTITIDADTTVIDYGALYQSILKTYWEGIGDYFNTEYWMYVVFDNAAYYISYAMSALPCLQLYAMAGNDGLEAARTSYLKLFTFSSNDEFVAEDSFGDLYVTKTYQEILNAAGLYAPFQESLYQAIAQYFASR